MRRRRGRLELGHGGPWCGKRLEGQEIGMASRVGRGVVYKMRVARGLHSAQNGRCEGAHHLLDTRCKFHRDTATYAQHVRASYMV